MIVRGAAIFHAARADAVRALAVVAELEHFNVGRRAALEVSDEARRANRQALARRCHLLARPIVTRDLRARHVELRSWVFVALGVVRFVTGAVVICERCKALNYLVSISLYRKYPHFAFTLLVNEFSLECDRDVKHYRVVLTEQCTKCNGY